MKTVLERAEELTEELSQLRLKTLKLLNIKISNNNPNSGSLRLKGYFDENSFIEVFEFLFLGRTIRYSYSFIKNEKPILRYDNAPYHKEIETYPHHKHLKDKIYALEIPQINTFIEEVIKLNLVSIQ